MNVAGAVRFVEEELAAAGIDSPSFTSRAIVAEVLFGGDLGRLPLERSLEVTDDQFGQINLLTGERQTHRPLQYILGYTEFFGLRLKCDPRALIPRPETELLAEALIAQAKETCPDALVAVDLGTGTGALALVLATQLPSLQRVYATDVSEEALALAAENARDHGLEERLVVLEGRDLEPLVRAGVADSVEIFVMNPPYVDASHIVDLMPEVRVHEPRVALVDETGTGRGFYSRVIPQLAQLPALRLFGCEVGTGMAAEVELLVAAALPGWVVRTVKDYPGYDRIVLAYAG